MSNKQHEAVRLIRAIADCVQTHPQLTEDEPGGYCTEADQLMDEAAALLRVWSVDIERKDALLRKAAVHLSRIAMAAGAPTPPGVNVKWVSHYADQAEKELRKELSK